MEKVLRIAQKRRRKWIWISCCILIVNITYCIVGSDVQYVRILKKYFQNRSQLMLILKGINNNIKVKIILVEFIN